MKKISVDDKDINKLLELDIEELTLRIDSSSDTAHDDYTNRANLKEKMNIIKKQCDKIINRINEYDRME